MAPDDGAAAEGAAAEAAGAERAAVPVRGGVTGSATAGAATPGGSSRNVYSRTTRPDAQFSSTIRSRNGSLTGVGDVTRRNGVPPEVSTATRVRARTP